MPSIPKTLEELQTYILHSHLEVEKLMEEMIRVKVWAKCFDKNNPLPSLGILTDLRLIVDGLPYRRKNEILCKLEPLFKPVSKSLNRVDGLRNKFAHTELSKLLTEYNADTLKGAQNIVNEYELIDGLIDEMVKIAQKVVDYTAYAGFMQEVINDTKDKSSHLIQ